MDLNTFSLRNILPSCCCEECRGGRFEGGGKDEWARDHGRENGDNCT